jgi:two-component system, OmpR family, sensor histidine kinase KdpD
VRVRETVPDSVLHRADELILVDVTPQALIRRLRGGKVYSAERIEAALNGFFRVENLEALREVALREVAEDVEARRAVTVERVATREEEEGGPEAEPAGVVQERLLALARPEPKGLRLVRRAWRSAQRLSADLDVLWVRAPGRPTPSEVEPDLAALRHLCATLGANMIEREGDDVVATAADVVRESGTTYVMIGEPSPARGLARLKDPLPLAIMHATPPGVDVRIVADGLRPRESGRKPDFDG